MKDNSGEKENHVSLAKQYDSMLWNDPNVNFGDCYLDSYYRRGDSYYSEMIWLKSHSPFYDMYQSNIV